MVTGVGRAGLVKMAAFVGAPPLSAGAYARLCDFVFAKVNEHYSGNMKEAHEGIIKYYTSRNIGQLDANNILDIEVSFNST